MNTSPDPQADGVKSVKFIKVGEICYWRQRILFVLKKFHFQTLNKYFFCFSTDLTNPSTVTL